MPYYVKIVGDDGRTREKFFKKLKKAENLYFRALAVVIQPNVADIGEEKCVRLRQCYLYEVGTTDVETAQDQISNFNARLLQTSVEEMGRAPVVIDGLFSKDPSR